MEYYSQLYYKIGSILETAPNSLESLSFMNKLDPTPTVEEIKKTPHLLSTGKSPR